MAAASLAFRVQPKHHFLGDDLPSCPIKSIYTVTITSPFKCPVCTLSLSDFFSYLSLSAHLSICVLPGLLPLGHRLQQSRDYVPLSLTFLCAALWVYR